MVWPFGPNNSAYLPTLDQNKEENLEYAEDHISASIDAFHILHPYFVRGGFSRRPGFFRKTAHRSSRWRIIQKACVVTIEMPMVNWYRKSGDSAFYSTSLQLKTQTRKVEKSD